MVRESLTPWGAHPAWIFWQSSPASFTARTATSSSRSYSAERAGAVEATVEWHGLAGGAVRGASREAARADPRAACGWLGYNKVAEHAARSMYAGCTCKAPGRHPQRSTIQHKTSLDRNSRNEEVCLRCSGYTGAVAGGALELEEAEGASGATAAAETRMFLTPGCGQDGDYIVCNDDQCT